MLKALVETYRSTLSKRDLKHSWTSFRKFACDLGFAGNRFLGLLPPEGDAAKKLTK